MSPRTVGKDDVGHRQETLAEADFCCGMDLEIPFGFHSSRDHRNHRSNKDTQECWVRC